MKLSTFMECWKEGFKINSIVFISICAIGGFFISTLVAIILILQVEKDVSKLQLLYNIFLTWFRILLWGWLIYVVYKFIYKNEKRRKKSKRTKRK
jgi:CBS domain containing-hemolysin-like protein